MKKLLVGLVLLVSLFIASPVLAGEIDGIWAANRADGSLSSILMVRETGGTMIVASLSLGMDDWEALAGPFTGSTAQLSSVLTRAEPVQVSLTFSSASAATAVVTGCTPLAPGQCEGVVGTTYIFVKVF